MTFTPDNGKPDTYTVRSEASSFGTIFRDII
jgi:hypothetical protein